MAKLYFYPIGNADTTLIQLNNGTIIIYDYCNKPLEENDSRINLEDEIRKYLSDNNKSEVDLLAFTHADDDHIFGAENLFWLEHAEKYQDEKRIKASILVVPASFILESGLEDTAKIIREEAKYRLKNGKGIFVIGEPEPLKDWLQKVGIDPDSRSHLLIHAGNYLPGFEKANNSVDIFIHSPFTFKLEDSDVPRNSNCLITQLTFCEGNQDMSCILGGDASWEDWLNIISLTQKNGNEERLNWDIFHISHHCSYTALSNEKGTIETTPPAEIEGLYLQGSDNCYLISPSESIPSTDTIQPPHKQAAKFYQSIAKHFGSEDNFIVTMEWPPKVKKHSPVVFETTTGKFRLIQDLSTFGGVTVITNNPSPRLG